MNVWKYIFIESEFAPRAHVLEGLSLEQAGARPAGAPHSIYEELWHAAAWQRIVLDQSEAAEERWKAGEDFPDTPEPENDKAWRDLVDSFLADLERAVQIGNDETMVDTDELEENPGITWGHALECLAVHNAYHLGKIVLLRQLLGAWTPAPEPEGAQA